MMDFLNEPVERIAKFVHEGKKELGEIPLARRRMVENHLAIIRGELDLEHDRTTATVEKIKASLDMKKTELQTIAIDLGIGFVPSDTKAELLTMIEEAQNAS